MTSNSLALPLVSIIIRTKNEESWIRHCLDAIQKQTYSNFEIVLVDNCSTDKTVLKASEYDVKVVNIDVFLPGKAINYGIKASQGSILVILSGHCIPKDSNWLINLISPLSDSKIAGVYGRQEPLSSTSDTDKRDLLITFGLDKKLQQKDPFFHNANSALRRETWEKFPFDEEVTNIEDRVWGTKVIEEGLHIAYEPAASVYHYHGIHQDRNAVRAKNVVSVMAKLHGNFENLSSVVQENVRTMAIVPVTDQVIKSKDFCLLRHTIEYLKSCQTIDDIFIATECPEVAGIASKLEVNVMMLSSSEAAPPPSPYQRLGQSLSSIEKDFGIYDYIAILSPNSPFRGNDMIDSMLMKAVDHNADSVIASKMEKSLAWGIELENNRNQGDYFNRTPLTGSGVIVKAPLLRAGLHSMSGTIFYDVSDAMASVEIHNNEELEKLLPLLFNK